MSSDYKHERLKLSANSIRLLQVQGGSKSDMISIRITQYAVHRAPTYAAISYTWGSPYPVRRISINGRPFTVRANLWNLLLHLRQRGESRFLWIDAICIDQQNLAERNFHVQLMSQIYDRSDFVLVWLGMPSDDRSEAIAMDFIKEMATFRQQHGDQVFCATYLSESYKPRWRTLLTLCKCTYWTRTWIIQEFVQAPRVEVICGSASIEWTAFEHIVESINKTLTSTSPPLPHIGEFLRSIPFRLTSRRLSHESSTLRELLDQFYDSKCTEPRDKIYGVLGIADDCRRDPESGDFKSIQPDYSKHIVQVYFDVIGFLAKTSEGDVVPPWVIVLVQKVLGLTQDDIEQYVASLAASTNSNENCEMTGTEDSDGAINHSTEIPGNLSIDIVPDYINIIDEIIPWTSASDLRQKLHTADWAKYVGYQVIRKVSSTASPNLKRKSWLHTTTQHHREAIPQDLIDNALIVAEHWPELSKLYNLPFSHMQTNNSFPFPISSTTSPALSRTTTRTSPLPTPNITAGLTPQQRQEDGFSISIPHLLLHTEDKKQTNNPSRKKPSLIIEQSESVDPIRLGFACTDVRKGDMICQFNGLDIALIARRAYGSLNTSSGMGLHLVGKAVMVTHRDLKAGVPLHPVCWVDESQHGHHGWYEKTAKLISPCVGKMNEDGLTTKADLLSLFECLSR